jgi:SAM-dependent methyltransferase
VAEEVLGEQAQTLECGRRRGRALDHLLGKEGSRGLDRLGLKLLLRAEVPEGADHAHSDGVDQPADREAVDALDGRELRGLAGSASLDKLARTVVHSRSRTNDRANSKGGRMSVSALDLEAVKVRQQAMWASGDFAEIATLIVSVAERLVDAADLRAGASVLDVACGSGNAAIAAARLGCVVAGIDYVPGLLVRGRERAAAERVAVDLREGDAEAIPFPDASFDASVSVFGSMFAPNQPRAAAELIRATRRGGTIALASWTPDGFVGAMFRTVGAHVPTPQGLASPMLWGTEEHLGDLFGDDVEWTHRPRTFTFRFVSAQAFVDSFASYYGPTVKAVEAAGDALEGDLRDLALSWNRLDGPGPIAVPATYLESVGIRR